MLYFLMLWLACSCMILIIIIVMNSKLLLAGVSLLGLIPAINYFKKAYQTKQPIVERKLMLQILRTMKKEYYLVFKQIAFMAEKIRAETKFTDEQVSALITGPGKPSNVILGLISDRILSTFKVSKQAFDTACEFYKQDDIEIGLLLSQLELEMALALKGNLKEYRGELPEWLTAERTFTIYTNMIRIQMKEQINIYLETIQTNVKECGPEELMKSPEEIDALLEKEGLNFSDEHGAKILQAAVERYFSKDETFKQRVIKAKRAFEILIKSVENFKVTVKSGEKTDTTFLDKLKAEIDNLKFE